jgi:hypothetical protein
MATIPGGYLDKRWSKQRHVYHASTHDRNIQLQALYSQGSDVRMAHAIHQVVNDPVVTISGALQL